MPENFAFFGLRAKRLTSAVLLPLALLATPYAHAQADNWPNRPIQIIAPTSPGSPVDVMAREFGKFVTERTGAAVVVENRPGGDNIIGSMALKNSAPDGYTYFMGSVSINGINPVLYNKLPYDPEEDFLEVGNFTTWPYVMLVSKDSPYNSLDDVLKAAKTEKGVSCAHSSAGSRIPCELIKAENDLNILSVPYKSGPDVLLGVGSNMVDFTIIDAMSAAIGVTSGRLKAIAVTSKDRMDALPGVQTFAESLPDFYYEGWAGLTTRKGTPPEIAEKMNGYMKEALNEPQFRAMIERSGALPTPRTVAEQNEFTKQDRERWKEFIKIANIPAPDAGK